MNSRIFSYRNIPVLEYVKNENPVSKVELARTETDEVLDAILCCSNVSGIGCSQISAYFNKKMSPELREYIRSNLILDMTSQRDNVDVPDGITDDDLHVFCRRNEESSEDYAKRVQRYVKDKTEYENDVKEAKKRGEAWKKLFASASDPKS